MFQTLTPSICVQSAKNRSHLAMSPGTRPFVQKTQMTQVIMKLLKMKQRMMKMIVKWIIQKRLHQAKPIRS